MKRYAIFYKTEKGVMMSGEILAECKEHAEAICEENDWLLHDEIPELFQVGTTH